MVALGTLLLLGGCARSSAPDTAVGTLEMVEVDVGPLQPARALRVLVQEGDEVQAGDTLVLFTTPTLASSTAQAEARAIAAQEASRELARGARPAEISRAQAELRCKGALDRGCEFAQAALTMAYHRVTLGARLDEVDAEERSKRDGKDPFAQN